MPSAVEGSVRTSYEATVNRHDVFRWVRGARKPVSRQPQPEVEVGEGTVVDLRGVPPQVLTRLWIQAGRNCSLDLSGLSVVNTSLHVHMADDCALTLGPGQCMNGAVRLFMHEPSSISVGADCLWASGDVWTSDMHSIIDPTTGRRLNPAGSVTISEHVWLGQDFLVLGGSELGKGSIVAARSVVTGQRFPPNCIIGGVPARVLRKGVSWDSRLL